MNSFLSIFLFQFFFPTKKNETINCLKYCNKTITKMPQVYTWTGYWTVQDVINNPTYLFVFGDNDCHVGKGGQAIIRDCPNSIGIPTKKSPSNNKSAFYNDTEYSENTIKITDALNNLLAIAPAYESVIFPEDGFGTGLADLPNKAPQTFQFLEKMVNKTKKKIVRA